MNLSLRDLIKSSVFSLASSAAFSAYRMSAITHAGVITILNLHRVAPIDGSGYRPLDPIVFRETLRFLRERFIFSTFAEIDEPSDKPRVILSFDDGYKDFIEVAIPILHEFGVVCNHNVIPECVETGVPPLNVLVQDFIGKAPRELVGRLDIPGFMEPVDKRACSVISSFIKNRPAIEQEVLKEALLPQIWEWQEFISIEMMSRSEVIEVARIHEIGAHSYSHASMGYESNSFVVDDVLRCKQYFHNVLGIPMDIYAFPNGSCTTEQIQFVLDAGVRHVLLVGESFDRGGRVHNRFTFDGRGNAEAKFRALGGFARVSA